MNNLEQNVNGLGLNPRTVISADTEVCTCGNRFFVQASVLKKLSALMSPTRNDEIVPVPLWICSKCGEPAPFFKNNSKFNDILGIKNIL